jgi:hypothetical protein
MNFIDVRGIKTARFLALLFTLCYAGTFPKTFLISDEWGYVGRAMALLNGSKSLIFNHLETGYAQDTLKTLYYPLGTSYLAALVILLFGKKMCFLVGFLSLLLSQFLMSKMVLKLTNNAVVSLLTWCCLPCLVISRTVMSDTPALLISAAFFFLYFDAEKRQNNYCLLGFIGGLSVLFRENLIVLFGLFLLKLFYEGTNLNRFLLTIGFSLGIVIRLLSANYFYDSPFFYKLTTPFATSHLFYNAVFYTGSLTLIYPLASLAVATFKHREAAVVKAAVFSYLCFFSLYAYTGLISGFLRSIVLTNRFFMPLLPLFMVAYAYRFSKFSVDYQRKIHIFLFTIACVAIIGSQIAIRYFEQKNFDVAQCAANSPTLIISPKVTCTKYINSITSNSVLIPHEACEINSKIINDVIEKQGYCDLFELDRRTGRDSVLSFKHLFIAQEICTATTSEGFTGHVTRLTLPKY